MADVERQDSGEQATRLISALGTGGRSAVDALLPVVYEELRALAASYLRQEQARHTLQPTALVNEVYLRLAGQSSISWGDRAHFMAIAARAMRNLLINHANARDAQKRGGGANRLQLSTTFTPAEAEEQLDALDLEEALTELARLDARKAQVVEMRFLGGMTVEEIAHVLNVSVSTVEADWRLARAWLSSELSET